MSDIGLPGLNGFIGELLVLLGTFITHRWWAVVATVGVVLGAVYLLWAYQRVFHGPAQAVNAGVRDMTLGQNGLAVAPLLAGIIFIGVYPQPVLTRDGTRRRSPCRSHRVRRPELRDAGFGYGARDLRRARRPGRRPAAARQGKAAAAAGKGANP